MAADLEYLHHQIDPFLEMTNPTITDYSGRVSTSSVQPRNNVHSAHAQPWKRSTVEERPVVPLR